MAWRVGIRPEEFWSLTPYIFRQLVKAWEEEHINQINNALTVAWHGAYCQRTDKFPDLKDILIKPKAKAQVTRDESIASLRAVFGPFIKRGGENG